MIGTAGALLVYSAAVGAMNNKNAEQPPPALVEQSIVQERPYFINQGGVWHAMTEGEHAQYRQDEKAKWLAYKEESKYSDMALEWLVIVVGVVGALLIVMTLVQGIKNPSTFSMMPLRPSPPPEPPTFRRCVK